MGAGLLASVAYAAKGGQEIKPLPGAESGGPAFGDTASKERISRPAILLEHGASAPGSGSAISEVATERRSCQTAPSSMASGAMPITDGFGKFEHADGDVYEGQWKVDAASGEGAPRRADAPRHGGQRKDVQKEGQGQHRAGKQHGEGKCTSPEGPSYVDEFQNREIHGKGLRAWSDGRVFNGQRMKNRMSGEGAFAWKGGRSHCGAHFNDEKDGQGTLRV
ncbi:unnamed protein product, partial [Prorocentrum cordatum]